MKKLIKVAICQRGATGATPQENLEKSLEMVERAAEGMPGLDLILLPECNNFLAHSREEFQRIAEPIPGPYTDAMAELAKKLHVNLLPGSITEQAEGGKVRNTAAFIDRQGNLLGKYAKIHLFDALGYKESDNMEAGSETCVLDTDFGRVGIQLCYDCRFPELARTLVLDGADILCIMAMFPGGNPLPPRTDHWDTLIDAMALQNQTWVCAANQYGLVGGEHPFGRSRVVDPWGTPVAVAGNHEDIIYATLDMEYQNACKESMGGLNNRRPDVYHN
ncbi:hypothetical protein H8790_04550 [Oscillibacter hominis]|uniref:CN hydrolase domain-containing protein n=1 Tax=Oscillibacter hominis TaxID=2763056 RepID=A0A7G9B6W1_9FIRM|nr:nitrilase-related carbon-nitrogen hydrolase [Oscillibacter hominis]QNL45292.1 hypothetical protein H8790_04550 [Oscillibacter hominis]